MAEAHLSISQEQLDGLAKVLNPRQLKQALYQAIKRTATAGAKIAKDDVKDEAEVQTKYVNRVIKSKTQGESPVGEITISQEELPLTAYKVRYARKRGAVITISKNRPQVVLKHAFVATLASAAQAAEGGGHKAVVNRERIGGTSKVTPKGFAWRLPIDERYGPSVLDLVERDKVEADVLNKIEATLEKNIDSQVSRFLGGQSLAQAVAAVDVNA